MDVSRCLIFTDLDGTLLDHHDYSCDAAIPVLRALEDRGHTIIPATSKTFAELNRFCQAISLNGPFLTENGAAVYLPLSFVNEKPKGCVQKGRFWCREFTHRRPFWLTLLETHAADFRTKYQPFSAMSHEQIASLTGLSLADATLAAQREFGEPLLWQGTEAELTAFTRTLESAGARILKGGRFVHVCGQCDKGTALRWLTECLAQATQQASMTTVALGDSDNDSAMLEQASIAIQIKSPVHPFPTIKKQQHLYKSTLYGPSGWAETLTSLILQPPRGGV